MNILFLPHFGPNLLALWHLSTNKKMEILRPEQLLLKNLCAKRVSEVFSLKMRIPKPHSIPNIPYCKLAEEFVAAILGVGPHARWC
jgi:hypothetical protein